MSGWIEGVEHRTIRFLPRFKILSHPYTPIGYEFGNTITKKNWRVNYSYTTCITKGTVVVLLVLGVLLPLLTTAGAISPFIWHH
jgi:hypothetical protein